MIDGAGRIIIALVRAYQRILSPFLPRCCRYYPTCSAYTIKAIELNGPFIGVVQGAIRILRCNPLFPGGIDFPRKKRLRMWKWSKELC